MKRHGNWRGLAKKKAKQLVYIRKLLGEQPIKEGEFESLKRQKWLKKKQRKK